MTPIMAFSAKQGAVGKPAALGKEIPQAGIGAGVVDLPDYRVRQSRTASRTIVDVFTARAKGKVGKRDIVPFPQHPQRVAVSPDLGEVVVVGPSQFDVGEHGAGCDDTVGPRSKMFSVTSASGERSPVGQLRPSLNPCLFHLEPKSCLRERPRQGLDSPRVFL